MNIFNIGKANARITELETELTAHKENSAAIEKQAEKFQADLQAAQAAIATEKENTSKAQAETKAANEKAAKLETDLKAAQDAVKDFEAKVSTESEKIGSKKALEITASLGTNPLKTPASTATNDAKTKTRAEFSAMNPRQKSDFCRAGGKLTD